MVAEQLKIWDLTMKDAFFLLQNGWTHAEFEIYVSCQDLFQTVELRRFPNFWTTPFCVFRVIAAFFCWVIQDGVMGQIEIPNKDVDDFIILRCSVLVSGAHVVLMGRTRWIRCRRKNTFG